MFQGRDHKRNPQAWVLSQKLEPWVLSREPAGSSPQARGLIQESQPADAANSQPSYCGTLRGPCKFEQHPQPHSFFLSSYDLKMQWVLYNCKSSSKNESNLITFRKAVLTPWEAFFVWQLLPWTWWEIAFTKCSAAELSRSSLYDIHVQAFSRHLVSIFMPWLFISE